MAQDFIQIAVITAAHGIRGQVKVRSFTDIPEALFSYPELWDATGHRTFKLTRQGHQAPNFIASIESIGDRNAAELLKGTGLFIPASALPEKTEDDLIGLEARLRNGQVYGTIIDLVNFGAGDIIEIELTDGKTEMLPFTEAFAHPEDGFITVFPPDYIEAKE